MLVVSHSAGFGSLGAPDPDLVKLKKEVDRCIRAFPLDSSNTGANISINCEAIGGNFGAASILPFEKLTFLEDEDNRLMFDIARSIITSWRNTASGPKESSTEEKVRRIAASKLGEQAVFDAVSPTQAVQSLSSAGRIESKPSVQLRIVTGLATLLSERDIPPSVRTEATTTLKILAGSRIPGGLPKSPDVEKAAEVALEIVDKKPPDIIIDPVTPTPPVVKPRSKWTIPIVASVATAVVAGGVLLYIFKRQPSAERFSSAGPLRRRVESRLRRRRAAR